MDKMFNQVYITKYSVLQVHAKKRFFTLEIFKGFRLEFVLDKTKDYLYRYCSEDETRAKLNINSHARVNRRRSDANRKVCFSYRT